MKGFFKVFFASLLALIVFCLLLFFFFAGLVSSMVQSSQPTKVHDNTVLTIELNTPVREQPYLNPINAVFKKEDFKVQGLHELIRGIKKAGEDPQIKGIYLKLNGNTNGYTTDEALRRALLDLK